MTRYWPVRVGEVWKRNSPGRERVRVERVWEWTGEGPTVRAHPIRGGRVLVAAMDWFIENYTRESA